MTIKSVKLTLPPTVGGVRSSITHTDAAITANCKVAISVGSEISPFDFRKNSDFFVDVPSLGGSFTVYAQNNELFKSMFVFAIYDTDGTGSSGGGGGATMLSELDDVNIPTPTDGQVLTYDNATSKWIATDSAAGATSLNELSDVDLDYGSPTIEEGEVLTFDFGNQFWVHRPLSALLGGGSEGQVVIWGPDGTLGDASAIQVDEINNTVSIGDGVGFDGATNSIIIGYASNFTDFTEQDSIAFALQDFPDAVLLIQGNVTDGGSIFFGENFGINLGNGQDETLANFNNEGDILFSSNDGRFVFKDNFGGQYHRLAQFNGILVSTNYGPNITSTTSDTFSSGTVVVGVDSPAAVVDGHDMLIELSFVGYISGTGDLEVQLWDDTNSNQLGPLITISSVTETTRFLITNTGAPTAGDVLTIQARIRSTVAGQTVNAEQAVLKVTLIDTANSGTIA